ncbi:tyrosine-type recombinase/integrase [Litoribrevibacter albus]|uniref:Integrase n=1 Tax=Litoribrevibacter albus TaxID=1473156 RepID=A0AA37W7P4_9GAMM|nr:tyrosine-type recombinase/integrase [Litoribrevibacter albus]GLQ31618.1 integrase [Litoribrevibacter albus]
MNRPRKKGNFDLPTNLYAEKRKKKVYYVYKHPVANTRHGMGSDRMQAILAAQQLNSMLSIEYGLVDKVIGRANTFASWIEKYIELRLSEDLSKKTVDQLKYDTTLMKEHLGDIPVMDITVFHCSEFLDKWVSENKRRMAARLRSALIKCFDFAVGNGLTESNPAKKTLPITVKVQRERLTKEQFDTIYNSAPIHIRNAMMLALLTLQRREDISNMKFSDIKDGYLHVIQKKTSKAKKGSRKDSANKAAYLRIQVTPALNSIIKSCRNTGVLSQFLIHQMITRTSSGALKWEVKKGQRLQPDNITRGFATAREKTGLFDDLEKSARPTFHEIRSLGAHLYKEQGIDPQALLGHTDEKMTNHYLDGHGIQWTDVSADLNVNT